MSEGGMPKRRVGVRELRQNLSVYLRRVKQGEELEVSERGRIVARLSPTRPADLSPLDRLMAEGRITGPTRPLADVGRPPAAGPGPALTDVLRGMRDEERG
jgi:prevent-host-death family protein